MLRSRAIGSSPLFTTQLILDALVLHLEEHVAVAENVAELRRRVQRLALASGADLGGHLPFEAAAQADEPLRVLCQQILVDARLVIEPFGVARPTRA